VRIYSSIRFGVTPTINAIGTLMMLISVATIVLAVALPRLVGRREDRGVLVRGEV
jgi:ABC-type spermidine/putrescine transport system permease subunit II